jgi:hypothetical protein
MFANEATRRIFTTYEVGDLITMCGWCRRVELDDEWVLAPRAALSAIDTRCTLSHSICPRCAARLASEPSGQIAAARLGYSASAKSSPSTTD